MATNLTATLYERQYNAAQDQSEPPQWFRHKVATLPATSLPVYPGWGAGTYTLNSFERAEVDRYIADPTDDVLASLTLPDAIAKANEFKTYFATEAYKAWRDGDNANRIAQWRLFRSDSLINNKGITTPSSDTGGSGSGTPPAYQPPGTDVP